MMPSDGSATTERYYVRATIKSIDDAGFGSMTIEDSTGTLSVYGTYSSDGAKRYSELDEKPEKVIQSYFMEQFKTTKTKLLK